MKSTISLFISVTLFLDVAALADSQTGRNPFEYLQARWDESMEIAQKRVLEIDQKLKTASADDAISLKYERASNTMPGLAIGKLNAAIGTEEFLNGNIRAGADEKLQLSPQKASNLLSQKFLLIKIREFLKDNPTYGLSNSDIYPREYVLKMMKMANEKFTTEQLLVFYNGGISVPEK